MAQCLGCPARGDLSSPPAAARRITRPSSPAAALGAKKGKRHLISTAFEHHAVLHTLKKLEKQGFEVTLSGRARGRPGDGRRSWRQPSGRTPALVTIMYANNEIGTIQPIADIGAAVPGSGAFCSTPTRCRRWATCPSTWRSRTSTCSACPATSSTAPRAWEPCTASRGVSLGNLHRGRRAGAGQAGRHRKPARHLRAWPPR